MTDLDRLYLDYTQAAQRQYALERDMHATPDDRRKAAHDTIAAWKVFRDAFLGEGPNCDAPPTRGEWKRFISLVFIGWLIAATICYFVLPQ